MNAKKLKEFIKLSTLDGAISPFLLEKVEDGIKITAKTVDNTSMVSSIIKGVAIEDDMPIKTTKDLIGAINFVGGEMKVERKDNKLFLSSTKDNVLFYRDIGLCSKEFIKDTHLKALPEFVNSLTQEGFKIKTELIKKLITEATSIEAGLINIKVENKKLTITASGLTDSVKIETEIDSYDCEGNYGEPFINVLNNINYNNVELVLSKDNKDFPIRIKTSSDNLVANFYIAPKQPDEVVEEKVEVSKEVEANF